MAINIVTPEHGSLSVSVSENVATITATPDQGYELDAVQATSGGELLDVVDMQFDVPEEGDVEVSATFAKSQDVDPATEGQRFLDASYENGEVAFSVGGDLVVAAYPGDTVDVSITPFVGYACTAVSGASVPTSGGSFTMPDANVLLEVTFSQVSYDVTCGEHVQADVSTAHAGDTVTAVPTGLDDDMAFLGFVAETEIGIMAQTIESVFEFEMPPYDVLVRQMTEEERTAYIATDLAGVTGEDGEQERSDSADGIVDPDDDVDDVDDKVDRDTGTVPTDVPPTPSIDPLTPETNHATEPGTEWPDPVPSTPDIAPTIPTKTVTMYSDQYMDDYSAEAIAALQEAGAVAVAVYDDGTEAEVPWSSVSDPARQNPSVANEAAAVANAINQHFWHRSTDPDQDGAGTGAFVTDEDREGFLDAIAHGVQPTESRPLHNLLMNSQGILLRAAKRIRAAFTPSGVAFYDGQGNNAANVVARFGSNEAQIGKDSEKHLTLSPYMLSYTDPDYAEGVPMFGILPESGTVTSRMRMTFKRCADFFFANNVSKVYTNYHILVRPEVEKDTRFSGGRPYPELHMETSRIAYGSSWGTLDCDTGDTVASSNVGTSLVVGSGGAGHLRLVTTFYKPMEDIVVGGGYNRLLAGGESGNDFLQWFGEDIVLQEGYYDPSQWDPLDISTSPFVKIATHRLSHKADASDVYTKAEVDTALSTYLPLAGGTLTGQLDGTAAVFSGNVEGNKLTFGKGAAGTRYYIVAKTPSRNSHVLWAGGGAKADGNVNGTVVGLGAGGLTIVGGGEYATNRYGLADLNDGDEQLYLGSDNDVTIESNGNTIANRYKLVFNKAGNLMIEAKGNQGYKAVYPYNSNEPPASNTATQILCSYNSDRKREGAYVQPTWMANGGVHAQFGAQVAPGGTPKYHYLSLGYDSDSNPTVNMTAKDKWRDALELGKLALGTASQEGAVDCDDLPTGIHYVYNASTNTPTGVGGMCICANVGTNSVQLFVTNGSSTPVHTRKRTGSTWTTWRQVG